MTKKGYTHITFILDRSGSMAAVLDDAIGGFNSLLEENKREGRECTMTLVKFDHEYETVRSIAPLALVEPLSRKTYVPRGTTALLDAVGRAIRETGEALSRLEEGARPERVMVAILTDGYENASREYRREQVAKLISDQERDYNWAFLFVATGIDAWGQAEGIGIREANYAGGVDLSVKAAAGIAGQTMSAYRAGSVQADNLLGDEAGNRDGDGPHNAA